MKNNDRVLADFNRKGVFEPLSKAQLFNLIQALVPDWKLKKYCLRMSDRYFLHAVVLRASIGDSSRFIWPVSIEKLFVK